VNRSSHCYLERNYGMNSFLLAKKRERSYGAVHDNPVSGEHYLFSGKLKFSSSYCLEINYTTHFTIFHRFGVIPDVDGN